MENVEFRAADAQKLDLADESVDGVLCRWGYMLVDEPARAFAETRRVLKPGGRVAFAVWASAEENQWASSIGRVLLERGVIERPGPDEPGPFRLADPDRVRELVEGAGLELDVLEDVPVLWRYDSFEDFWDVSRDLSRMLAAALGSLDEDGGGRGARGRPGCARPVCRRCRARHSGADARRAGTPTSLIVQRIVLPRALATSSTAVRPVRFSRSRMGFTSTTSSEPAWPDSATSSSARCASR